MVAREKLEKVADLVRGVVFDDSGVNIKALNSELVKVGFVDKAEPFGFIKPGSETNEYLHSLVCSLIDMYSSSESMSGGVLQKSFTELPEYFVVIDDGFVTDGDYGWEIVDLVACPDRMIRYRASVLKSQMISVYQDGMSYEAYIELFESNFEYFLSRDIHSFLSTALSRVIFGLFKEKLAVVA